MDSCKKRFIIKTNIAFGQGPPGPEGPPGQDGEGIELPLSSDDVEFNGQTLTEVIEAILYTPLVISSFSASPSVYEKGQVLISVSLAWSFNKSIESQSITGTNVFPPSLGAGERNKIVSLNNIVSDTVVTLTADDINADAIAAKTSQLTLSFLNKAYWGISVIPGAINSAFVLGLGSSTLTDVRQRSFVLAPGTNQYIWYAYPVSLGAASFKTNGFIGGLSLQATISFTNASGFTENYYVYRSDNPSLGSTLVEVL